ncbi:MAG TPA: sodium:glutamate symporter [Candidatus Limnocylindria bacterium]|nr:sodium:glutamate symporter [Candidatus Limnocylindria bacterium]
MDFTTEHFRLWSPFIWSGIIAGLLLFSHFLTRKVAVIRKSLIPVAALSGFILLALRSLSVLRTSAEILETLTYHGISLGFIALALRTRKAETGGMFAFKSGALIVSTYLLQGIIGLIISASLFYTFMPGLFPASGILLPMAYGQGPGQASNVGATYQNLGFLGGRSFGLSLAAAGYLTACVVGIWFTRRTLKQRGLQRTEPEPLSGSVMTETFQEPDEVPLSESVDRLSIQIALILVTYLATYLVTLGATSGLQAVLPGLARTLNPLLWGFNFITGSLIAMLTRGILSMLRKKGVMHRQYQNNYLLNRISGLAFDVMIVAGIASINILDMRGLWVPFLLMAVLGGAGTYYYLRYVVPRVTPGYADESFIALYGMLCGTISSGILPLRQIDPEFRTPAADQLVAGSGTAIVFGAPMLILIGLAPVSQPLLFVTILLCAAYMAALVWFLVGRRRKAAAKAASK